MDRTIAQGGSQADVAKEWNISPSALSNKLRLLSLDEHWQELNRHGILSERKAHAVLQLQNASKEVPKGKKYESKSWREFGKSSSRPMSPHDALEYVIEHPEASSDLIRKETEKIIIHAGHSLPATIITLAAVPAPEIVQVSCKGCPDRRLKKFCLTPKCINAKKRQYAANQLLKASEALELPIAPQKGKGKYKAGDRFQRQQVGLIFTNGGCEHLHVAWTTEEYAARPDAHDWTSQPFSVVENSRFANGIAIGHNGPIPEECHMIAEKGEENEEQGKIGISPVQDQLATEREIKLWDKIYKQAPFNLESQIRAEIAKRMKKLWTKNQRSFLVSFLNPELYESETLNTPENILNWLAKYLYEKGRMWNESGRLANVVAGAERIFSYTNIPMDFLKPDDLELAHYLLGYWYAQRLHYWYITEHDVANMLELIALAESLDTDRYPVEAAALQIAATDLKWWATKHLDDPAAIEAITGTTPPLPEGEVE